MSVQVVPSPSQYSLQAQVASLPVALDEPALQAGAAVALTSQVVQLAVTVSAPTVVDDPDVHTLLTYSPSPGSEHALVSVSLPATD